MRTPLAFTLLAIGAALAVAACLADPSTIPAAVIWAVVLVAFLTWRSK